MLEPTTGRSWPLPHSSVRQPRCLGRPSGTATPDDPCLLWMSRHGANKEPSDNDTAAKGTSIFALTKAVIYFTTAGKSEHERITSILPPGTCSPATNRWGRLSA